MVQTNGILVVSFGVLHSESPSLNLTFTIVKFTQLCSKFQPTSLLNFACDDQLLIGIEHHTLGLVNRPNDISLLRANQSQAKFKSAVDGNVLQRWVNLTIAHYLTSPGERRREEEGNIVLPHNG